MAGPRAKYGVELNEKQEKELQQLSGSYQAPWAEVQRARILLLAHQQPKLSNSEIGKQVGVSLDMVKQWRKRWQQNKEIKNHARSGAPRRYPALVRAQITALACRRPKELGKVWQRWSGEKLAQVAVEEKIVDAISPASIRRWLRADKIKPWNYHNWQKSKDPQFVEKAIAVLDLYENANKLAKQDEAVVCMDEKTSIQARQRINPTKAAIAAFPIHIADRYRRMGALNLFCALMVATGLTFVDCFAKRCFADFKIFLLAFFASTLCTGLKVVHLILDNGPTHAPKQLANWIISLNLAFEVRIYWLPKYASWLDQVEIIFSKLQRDVLTPNDFPSTIALENDLKAYFVDLNLHPKPIIWSYTKTKLIAKFGSPPQKELVA